MRKTAAELWFVHDLAALLINTGRQPITLGNELHCHRSEAIIIMTLQCASISESVPRAVSPGLQLSVCWLNPESESYHRVPPMRLTIQKQQELSVDL